MIQVSDRKWIRIGTIALASVLVSGPASVSGAERARATELSLQPTLAEPAGIAFEPRFSIEGAKTRFSMRVSEKMVPEAFVLADPNRVVIEIPDVTFDFAPVSQDALPGLITAFRHGRFSPGRARIVFAIAAPVRIENSHVRVHRNGGFSYSLLLSPSDAASFKAAAGQAALRQSASRTPWRDDHGGEAGRGTPGRNLQDAAHPPHRPVIVLDPGHGGIDGGTTGRLGTREKDVVLAFAHALKRHLSDGGRFDIRMTRTDDRFVSLPQRLQFARAAEAALFISFHADAFNENSVRGTTIYTGSRRATDRQAAAYAEKENRADLVAGLSVSDMPKTVVSILDDLMMRETKAFSTLLARKLIKNIRKITKVRKYPHKRANFFVLSAPGIPSVLIELGYMSNRRDEERLQSIAWRDKVAAGMSAAIHGYFNKHTADIRAP